MLWNGRDTDDPRDWEPCPLTELELYARKHPEVRATFVFLDNSTKTYSANRAAGIVDCALNRGTIKSIASDDKAFEAMLLQKSEN